ncbi:hypothetical protein IU433_13860 [Nocardia puris]|uniref:hypothetical protein n=1 Tax=Nocardia puris TaxID=208602 RepID=UPI001893947E|nr:hypothetical protein [Nocardia puris]MBF6214910.1 hypothetical protein [Nocardia puris]MBF6364754.1 hypothetical protein [Nocardia puris]MBF6460122.1 hypothetical protein [Nocardia puris]
MRTTLMAAALVALPLLAGCGGDAEPVADVPAPSTPAQTTTTSAATSSSTPTEGAPAGGDLTEAEIAAALTGKGLPQKQADCAARIYVEEEISESGLREILETDFSAGPIDSSKLELSAEDRARLSTASQRLVQECIL